MLKGSRAVTPPLSMAKGHNQNASADGNAAVPSPLQGRMFQKQSPLVLASARMHCSGGNVKLLAEQQAGNESSSDIRQN